MKWLIDQFEEGKRVKYVHADHPYQDYTLCGLALEGMGRESQDEHTEAVETNLKINCKSCIEYIKHCKRIKL